MKNSKNVIITRIDGSIKKIRLPNPQIISEGFSQREIRLSKLKYQKVFRLLTVMLSNVAIS